MRNIKIRPICWSLYVEGDCPIRGKTAIHVRIEDEGCGHFLTIQPSLVDIDPTEIEFLMNALSLARQQCEEIDAENRNATAQDK